MGFFSGLFGGSNKTLDQNIPAFQQAAGFATGIGENDVTNASKWYNDILSGDPTKMAAAVAPQTSAIQGQTQQDKNQAAQFSPRSGGTASWMAGLDANTRAQIIKLLGGLQSGAAGSLTGIGMGEQGLALSEREAADQAAIEKHKMEGDSVLGQAIGTGVGALEDYGISKLNRASQQPGEEEI
jgi:hypothetical protein